MKFSIRQILASVVGAVLAAVIASAFGVKGTIVGVAIGSAAATIGTALVAQSIERGHEAVRQVVVRAPEDSVLRRLGTTAVGGETATSVDESSVPTEAVASAAASTRGGRDGADGCVRLGRRRADRTEPLEVTAAAGTPATQRLDASASVAPVASRRFTWKAIAGTAGVVFLAALLFVTVVELIAGKPLSSIFGHAGTGTSSGRRRQRRPRPPPSTTTTTSTPTTSTSSSTTTTSTTQPIGFLDHDLDGGGSSSTTTTSSTGGSTTTTNPGSVTTTSGDATSTTAPGT